MSTGAAVALEEIAVRGVQRGLDLPDVPVAWQLDTFCGRLAEISGHHACAALSLVFRLVWEAQKQNEPVAWVGKKQNAFFPPDVAEGGVDLSALAVIWTDATRRAARAADQLVRSGAFGLVVLDVGSDDRVPPPMQTRLAGLAKRHGTALLCITDKDSQRPSLGSLVSLRAEALRIEGAEGRFRCEVRVLKDKRRGPGWKHIEVCHGPDGLC